MVGSEPVAWQPKYKQEVIDHHRKIGSDLWEYAMTVYPTKAEAEGYGYGGHEARALYASIPDAIVAGTPLQYLLFQLDRQEISKIIGGPNAYADPLLCADEVITYVIRKAREVAVCTPTPPSQGEAP